MNGEIGFAARTLKNVSSMMDYELLVSRPGVSEPDSDFIWASTFRAPIGISFIGEEVYFNLILPEGSENEGDKKLFLKRVNANLQDGLWQVRRSMDQMNKLYGPAIKAAVTAFKSMVLDHTYIKNGRTYAHFTFNERELPEISAGLLSSFSKVDGLRVEYLKRARKEITVFNAFDESDEVSAVTLDITPEGEDKDTGSGMHFLLANLLDDGVKTVARTKDGVIPEFIKAAGVTEVGDGICSFYSHNKVITELVETMATDHVVAYGLYGVAGNESISLTVNVPTQQTPSLVGILRRIMEDDASVSIKLREIIYFEEVLEELKDACRKRFIDNDISMFLQSLPWW